MKRLLRPLALLSALLLLLPACHHETSAPSGTDYQVWFAAPGTLVSAGADTVGGPAVVSEARRVPEGADPVEGLLAALLAGPSSEELVSPFPRGLRLRSTSLSPQGVLTVDLDEKYGGLSGVALTVADYCIALTLCQLDTVEAVIVTVDGRPVPFRDHQTLRPGDVLLSGAEGEPVTITVSLYYPSPQGLLIPQEQDILITANGTRASVVLSALLSGENAPEGSLPLPQADQIRSAVIEGGVCYVDCSAGLFAQAPDQADQAQLTLYAIVNTLCALDGVEGVQLLSEGAAVSTYGSVDAGQPLAPMPELVQGWEPAPAAP